MQREVQLRHIAETALLDDHKDYLHVVEGESEEGYTTFRRAGEIGEDFDDPILIVLARQSCGRVLIRMGKSDEGVRLLGEAMRRSKLTRFRQW